MSRLDLNYGFSVLESLPTTVVSGGGDNGTAVDLSTLKGYAAKHILHVEAVTTTITVKLQDSPAGSVWTDVPAAQMVGGVNLVTITDTEDNTAAQICGFNLQPFQRIVTVAGAGTIHAVAVVADTLGS